MTDQESDSQSNDGASTEEAADAGAAYPPVPGEPTAPVVDTPSVGGATRALSRILEASYFLDLHDRANGGNHPIRYWLCFSLDLFFRLVAIVIILGIAAGVAWKTLAPFPRTWWH